MNIHLINFKSLRRLVLSFGLSCILWFFVTENSTVIDQKTVDIQYRGLPDNVLLVESLQKISYTISKNPYYPDNVKINIIPYVDIKDITPGWHTFPIKMEFSSPLPTYVKARLSVDSARILLDNKSVKNITLKPNIELPNSNDFSISNLRISPSITQITGPESVLADIKDIFLDTVNISKAGDFKMDVRTLSPASSIIVKDQKVSLQFSIESNYITQTVSVPIRFKNLIAGLTVENISTKMLSLQLKGLKSQFDAIGEKIDNVALIDLTNIDSPGAYPKVPIRIELPYGMTILNTKNLINNVDVIINEKKSLPDDNQKNSPSNLKDETNAQQKDNVTFFLEDPYANNTEINDKKEAEKSKEIDDKDSIDDVE